MKQTNQNRDYKRTSIDRSHRTWAEIKAGPPKPKKTASIPKAYLEKPQPKTISLPDLHRANLELNSVKLEMNGGLPEKKPGHVYDSLEKARLVAEALFSKKSKNNKNSQ